jgi:hypothetical protein
LSDRIHYLCRAALSAPGISANSTGDHLTNWKHPMPDPAFPAADESLARLRRSGWSCGEAAFTDSSGRTVWQVDGWNGENVIAGRGDTPSEAWHRACEAAAAVGMLADWPRPQSGR